MVWKRYAFASIFILLFNISYTPQAFAYEDVDGYEYYDSQPEYYDNYTEPRNDHQYTFVRNDGPDYPEMYEDEYAPPPPRKTKKSSSRDSGKYASRMPSQIPAPGEKVIIINPRAHAWGAYNSSGDLVRAGVATSGANYCADVKRRCRTSVGSFRIFSLGSAHCKSSKYPLPRGGAPMPYCMYFNKNQAIHGSNQVADANLSHGCVRVRVSDAEWLRFNFANIGTRVIIKSY